MENDKKRFSKMRKLTTRGIYDNDKVKDGAAEGSQRNNFIPLQEYIEFLKDMRDILNTHKDLLLLKMSTFYLSKPKK